MMVRKSHNAKYPWRTMEVGESFFSALDFKSMKKYSRKVAKRIGCAFLVEPNGCGAVVTRLPDPEPKAPPVINPVRGVWTEREAQEFLDRMQRVAVTTRVFENDHEQASTIKRYVRACRANLSTD